MFGFLIDNRASKGQPLMEQLNRCLAILLPRQPYVDWLNSLPESREKVWSLEDFNDQGFVYGIPHDLLINPDGNIVMQASLSEIVAELDSRIAAEDTVLVPALSSDN